MTLWLIVGAILLLVALSAFFSGSETALTAASKARMHQLEKTGDRRAALVSRLIEDRERLIGAILLGNNVVNILASALATSVLLTLFGQAGVAYATIGMTILVLVFGEILPKTLAIGAPDRVARGVAPIVNVLVIVLSPIVYGVQVLVRMILRGVGWNGQGGDVLSATDEIRGQVDLLHAEGSVVKSDRDRLGGLLDLGELAVSDIMVHRTDMHAVNLDEPTDRIVEGILASPYTRVPLWEGEPENIVGVVHTKDLVRALKSAGDDMSLLDIRSIAKKPWFIPDITEVSDQLNAFLKRKSHFALVVDEYGEVQGLITLEDIIEEIVGEISDEHDIVVQGVRPQPDGSVNVDGAVPIRDLNRAMGWQLPDDEATTIAGLVIHEARIIPEPGQAFTFHGFRFQVLRKNRNRLTALHITPLPRDASAAA
jgi:Mg2+/Co2+ transporter CorB